MDLLHVAPYVIGATYRTGKIHAIRKEERSYCGCELRYQPAGSRVQPGDREDVTCEGCQRSLDVQDRRDQQKEEWEQRKAELEAERAQENKDWWIWYTQYLASPEWRSRRNRVLERSVAGNPHEKAPLCEGCRSASPAHIHHLSYAHAGDEFLYELVALCTPCHQKAHPDKEIGR